MSTSSDASSYKLLIIAPSWVGDMIMAQSLFILLKQRHPHCQLDVMAPTWSSPILERMPEVDGIIDMPLGHGQLQLKTRYQLGKSLRDNHYNQTILLPNSLKSALVPFWAKIPKRTGFLGESRYGLLNDYRKLDKQFLSMTVQRFCALAYEADQLKTAPLSINEIPVPSLHISTENSQLVLDKFKLSNSQPILALCPGAEYGPAKQWPAKYYAEIAKLHQKQNPDEKVQVWIFGSEKDAAIADEINQFLNQTAVNLCGKTQLSEAIDLMSFSQLVISNDSGLMHMAAALAVPIVGVYGSSDPNFTPPLGQHSATLSLNLECSPCFKRTCPLSHTNCLENLKPELVLDAAAKLLK